MVSQQAVHLASTCRGGVIQKEGSWRWRGKEASQPHTVGRAEARSEGGSDEEVWAACRRYGMVWYGMVWYGMVWYGMVWYGMVWYVVVVVVRAPSTCRREKLPDTLSLGRAQGSSRPASRWPGVCRQRPGGGGGGAWCGGGGGARVEEGGATCGSYPGALPRCGGEGDPTCEKRWRRGGAGWRDHLSGDMRGPDSPYFQPPLPRDRGGGYFLCEGGVRGWRGRGICMVYSLR